MPEHLTPIRTALLSTYDKTGVVELARTLRDAHGVKLLASAGTAKAISDAAIEVTEVAEHTGAPEILGGRVKTLHPRIHGGILADRSREGDRRDLDDQNIEPIDCVIANLYPFVEIWRAATEEARAAHAGGGDVEAAVFSRIVEHIDIGGPAMIRAAAKNHEHVTVVTNPADYGRLLDALRQHHHQVPQSLRIELAQAAFRMTAAYDAAITTWLEQHEASAGAPPAFPDVFVRRYQKAFDLRYGENPHQVAAFYREAGVDAVTFAGATQLHGQTPSYNNILDCDSALGIVRELEGPAACVVKHMNPCGAAVGDTLLEAFRKAHEADPVSAYGGIIGLNRPVDLQLAEALLEPGHYFECIVAESFDEDALERLRSAPKWAERVRLFETGAVGPSVPRHPLTVRGVDGGLLVQSTDDVLLVEDELECVTETKPTEEQRADLELAWAACKHTKSNAIVFAKGGVALGIGAGQMSRVDAVHCAVHRSGERANGAVMASDAFFPFPDGIELAIAAGITAVIQPGGSIRDKDAIKTCNEAGIPMLFTHLRHFRH